MLSLPFESPASNPCISRTVRLRFRSLLVSFSHHGLYSKPYTLTFVRFYPPWVSFYSSILRILSILNKRSEQICWKWFGLFWVYDLLKPVTIVVPTNHIAREDELAPIFHPLWRTIYSTFDLSDTIWTVRGLFLS